MMPLRTAACLGLLCILPAHAVIVRGRVTTPLGVPLPGARIQLIQGPRSVADTISGADGVYEIQTSFSGRFLLLSSASIVAPQPSVLIGQPFYAGRTDLVTQDIVLTPAAITPQLSAVPTLVPAPLPALATSVLQLRADQFLTPANVIPPLATLPGQFIVTFGSFGAPSFLYLQGAGPSTLRTILDGVSAEDFGGGFNLSTLSSSGLSAISAAPALELTAGALPTHLIDAQGGTLALHEPVAESLHPVLNLSGDAGNLAALRGEGVFTITHSRADALASFSRFDTAGNTASLAAPFHIATAAANLGYHISAGTSLRATLRNDVSAGPQPTPLEFFGVRPASRLAAQNLFASATFSTVTASGWHNLLRGGIARKRSQDILYTPLTTGQPVTITGANGYQATGTALFAPQPGREDLVTNRNELTWQSGYTFRPWLALAGAVRYQQEHAADLIPALRTTASLTHISAALSFTGDYRHRLFYQASGMFDHSQAIGFTGAPQFGVTYAPVRPGARRLRGTVLHASAATGTGEPSLLALAAGIRTPPRSRTLQFSLDQNILRQKLVFSAAYFHDQFSHQPQPTGLATFTTPAPIDQSLAYRTQGVQLDLRYRPLARLLLRGGYTYLASQVEQTSTTPVLNPNLPAISIGALSPLIGDRPFYRPPQTAIASISWSGARLSASFNGLFASRSDSTTGLVLTPALLLPNRNLSPSWASLDADVLLALTRHVTVYTQLTNLADSRHLAPLGYISSPFMVRAGLRFRLGRE